MMEIEPSSEHQMAPLQKHFPGDCTIDAPHTSPHWTAISGRRKEAAQNKNLLIKQLKNQKNIAYMQTMLTQAVATVDVHKKFSYVVVSEICKPTDDSRDIGRQEFLSKGGELSKHTTYFSAQLQQ